MALDHKLVEVVGWVASNGQNAISRDQHPTAIRRISASRELSRRAARSRANSLSARAQSTVRRCRIAMWAMRWPRVFYQRPRRRGPACNGRRRRTATRPDPTTMPDRSAGRRVHSRHRFTCSDSTHPSPNVLLPNAIRGVTLRRPNSSRTARGLSWCYPGQRQSLRQDVLRGAEFEGFEIAIHQISFHIRSSSTPRRV